ncbi:serine hydrolase [Altererythrobacter salegens]|uniref:Serine hydrolase n=1 Tax=Croceibacterium salegens TaxID=1737568 RepID=A0A6I4SWH9_9SPHN|nr:serine hydrolase [Croceibacterium salegens]MXO60361.1 serine hydrolase [Croceibacterium salegens]
MHRAFSASIAALLCVSGAPALADPPDGFVQRVEELREESGAPAIAIAIVEHGKTTLAKGWGVRKLGESAPVDEHTIFPTGSTGKAFTTAALATLVDQGKLGWDDKVIDHMPWFRMYDPWVTNELTVRDLLVHRSGLGLGAGDLLYVPRTSLTRRETVERLRYIKPATSFRYSYAYDNILYIAAGQLIEEVTGKTWEQYVKEEVLERGGMTDSTSDYDSRYATDNRAFPHARVSGAVRGDGPNSVLDEHDELGRNAMPAGGLAMSASDLAKWLQIQLGHGALPGGGQLFSEEQAREMWQPVTIQPITQWPGDLATVTPSHSAYALGWDVEDYRGHKLIWHNGAVFGAIAVVAMLPDEDVGFAIVINSEESALRRGLMYELLDHYLGLPFNDWTPKWDALIKQMQAGGKEAMAQMTSGKTAKARPSLPLASYAGTYRDPWYGDVVVSQREGGLWIDFASTPRMEGRLVPYQYDTFRTELTDKALEPALVTFQLDADGKVERIKMVAASPLADFSYDYQDLDLRPVKDAQ